jgi:hypothetical protein
MLSALRRPDYEEQFPTEAATASERLSRDYALQVGASGRAEEDVPSLERYEAKTSCRCNNFLAVDNK